MSSVVQPISSYGQSPESNALDRTHRVLSQGIVRVSDRIDRFFASDRYLQEENKTVVQLIGQNYWVEGEGSTLGGDVRIQLQLPSTQKRVNFVFEQLRDTVVEENTRNTTGAATGTVAPVTDYAASLRYSLLRESKWNLNVESGLSVKIPLELFARARLRRTFQISNRTSYRAIAYSQWRNLRGLTHQLLGDYDFNISPSWLFRASSSYTYQQFQSAQIAAQTFAFFHTLSERLLITYFVSSSIAIEGPDSRNLGSILAINFRRRLYEKWLYLDLQPRYLYRPEDQFGGVPGVFVQIESVFGGI